MERDGTKRPRIDEPGYQQEDARLVQRQSQFPRFTEPETFPQHNFEPQSGPTASPGMAQSNYGYNTFSGSQFMSSSYHTGAVSYNVDYSSNPQVTPQQQQQQQQQQQYAPQVSTATYNAPPIQHGYQPHYYDTVPRQPILPSQYGVSPQPYTATQATQPRTQSTPVLSSHIPTQYARSSFDGSSTGSRSYLPSSFPPAISTAVTAGIQSAMGAGALDSPITELNIQYAQYHASLRTVFDLIGRGDLMRAAQTIVELSHWLVGNVERYGLNRDNTFIRDDDAATEEAKTWRLELWKNFNEAWIAVLQKQLEVSQEDLDTGQRSQTAKGRISFEYLKKMGDDLVSLCDSIEKYGLVDFEVGIWEDQIIDLLKPCRSIARKLEDPAEEDGSSGSAPNALLSASVSSRSSKRKR